MADEAPKGWRIERVRSPTADSLSLLSEYYEAMAVVVRDSPEAMQVLLADPRSAMFIAFVQDVVAGCVILKADTPFQGAGECKRLYVRPAFRRAGLAKALMEALEAFARSASLDSLYLDTNEEFRASVALYRELGYKPCERYNDNPQATLFFRKRLDA